MKIDIPERPEPFNEKIVFNSSKSHKKYVQKMGKKYDSESAFMRAMLDYFINNMKFVENDEENK